MRFSKVNYFFCVLLGTMLLSCSPEDGTDGVPGLSNLTILNDEPSGANCENGGVRIENGLDLNSNAILETSEVLTTTFLCDGFNSDYQDETRLVLFSNGSGASGTSSVEGRKMGEIIKFDKRNWENASSIYYVAWIYSENSNNSCFVELFNETDGEVIANSVLTNNSTNYPGILMISENIISSIPEKEIDISLRLRSENEGTTVYMGRKAELVIKR
ncbi:hypothetical protein SAMN04487910_3349 [Aquimarina amphilecti]|uniref:DUF7151 domain-containing protein n=1 Tax=Aquimarina amphilecti TaxID=1038014 RepID=A0A1H7TAV6_AQUAM|nr:hypothetical protein [Aquimarina amphilecti]SEL81808.1 hypothetical protein SAMN04487910_3349 [Aquimarina amphilecti]